MNKLNKVSCVAIGKEEGSNNLYYVQTCCAGEHSALQDKKVTCKCRQVASKVDLATAKRIARETSLKNKVKVQHWYWQSRKYTVNKSTTIAWFILSNYGGNKYETH